MIEIYKFSFSNSAAGGEMKMGIARGKKPQRPFKGLLQLLILLIFFSILSNLSFASTIITIYNGNCINFNEKIGNYTNSTVFCVVLNSTTAYPQSQFYISVNSTYDTKGILLNLTCDNSTINNYITECYSGHVDVHISDVSNSTENEIAVNYSTNYSRIGIYFPTYNTYVNKTLFVWDNEPPSIDLHTDLFQNVTKNDNLTIYFVTYDNSHGLLNCSFNLYNYSIQNKTFYLEQSKFKMLLSGNLVNFTFDTNYGIKKSEILCKDAAGNLGKTSFYFAVDDKRPKLKIYKPFNSTTFIPVEFFIPSLNGGNPSLNYTLSDLSIDFYRFLNSSLPGVYCYGYLNNLYLKTMAYDKFFNNLESILNNSDYYLKSGKNTLFVECSDTAGNKASALKIFYVDKEKPKVFVKISPYIVYGMPDLFSFNATFLAFDDASKKINCTMSIYNNAYLYYKKWFLLTNGSVLREEIKINKSSPIFTTPLMTVTYSCGDNITMESDFSSFAKYHTTFNKTYFLLDTMPPKVYVLFPNSLNYIGFANKSIIFRVKVFDDTNKLLKCFYQINNSLGVMTSKIFYLNNGELENLSIDPDFVAQGWNKFVLICKDGGNRTGVFPNPSTYSQHYLRFLADFQAPTRPHFKTPIFYLIMFNGSVFNQNGEELKNISWRSSEDNINVTYYKIYISNYFGNIGSSSIISKVNALNVSYTVSNGIYVLSFSNETGSRIEALGNLPILMNVYAYDELGHRSAAGSLVILPVAKEIANSNMVCFENKTCYLNLSNVTYLIGYWTWHYNQTNNVKVNETIKRWPLIHVFNWLSKGIFYRDAPIYVGINNGSTIDPIILRFPDNRLYHLPDNKEISLRFSRTLMPGDMLCVSGFTTNNSTLYVLTKLGPLPLISDPPTAAQKFNISCIDAESYGLNYSNVTLLCAQGTHSCYINFVGIVNNLGLDLKLDNLKFEEKNSNINWQINVSDLINSENLEYEAKNFTEYIKPLIESYSWNSRIQNKAKVTEADKKAYSILPIHIKNVVDIGFSQVSLITPKECRFENTSCFLSTINFVPPATTTTFYSQVVMDDAVIDNVISRGTLAEKTIYVGKQTPAYFTLEIENKDIIPYFNVLVNPTFDGWIGDPFKVNLNAGEKITKRILMHKTLIVIVKKTSSHENLPACRILNEFTYVLNTDENISSYEPQSVVFKEPLSRFPGINREGLRVLFDGKNVTFNISNGYLMVELPTTMQRGTHPLTIEYVTISHSCGRPVPLKKKNNKLFLKKQVPIKKLVEEKKLPKKEQQNKAKNRENSIKSIELQMSTSKLIRSITFEIPETILDIKVAIKNAPNGLKVKILNSKIPFAKKNTTLNIKLEIEDKGLSPGIHSFIVSISGKTPDGKIITLEKKIILDKTSSPTIQERIEKSVAENRANPKIIPKITGFFYKFMANPEYVLIIFVVFSILILLRKKKKRGYYTIRKHLNLRGKI